MIVIEDLKVSNMSKSAKGTTERHGRNVKAKSGLNRSILEQGWYEMRRQLEYKQPGEEVRYWQYPRLHQSEVRLLWSYSKGKPPVTKSIRVPLNVDIQRMLISTGHVTF